MIIVGRATDAIRISNGWTFLKASYLTDRITLLYYDPPSALKQKRNVILALHPFMASSDIEESEIMLEQWIDLEGFNQVVGH